MPALRVPNREEDFGELNLKLCTEAHLHHRFRERQEQVASFFTWAVAHLDRPARGFGMVRREAQALELKLHSLRPAPRHACSFFFQAGV